MAKKQANKYFSSYFKSSKTKH